MGTMQKKSFNEADEVRNAGRLRTESVTIGSFKYLHNTAQPGWSWSEDVKPLAKTETCQVRHLIYMISGRIRTRMADGTELDFSAGDVGAIPPGHDGWTLGDEPAVWLDLQPAG
jgi:hypothetical protein